METLSSQDQRTYDSLFRHPASGNIEWHAIKALLGHIGEVIDEPNGNIKFLLDTRALTLRTRTKDADQETIEAIRRFLKGAESHGESTSQTLNYLLVLDFAEARVYQSQAQDAERFRIEPYDPHGQDKHVHDKHEYARPHIPDLHHEFYQKIAEALKGAHQILIFGTGKGSSQEFDHMLEDLKRLHPEIESRVIGAVNLDLSHLTEGDILAKAREKFASSHLISLT